MNNIVKICKNHGNLLASDVYIRCIGQYTCKACIKKKNKKRIREYDKAIAREYRVKNKDKIKQNHLRYLSRNPEKRREYVRKYEENAREKLNNKYIKKLITRNLNLKYQDIPDTLVETYRVLLTLKRMLKVN